MVLLGLILMLFFLSLFVKKKVIKVILKEWLVMFFGFGMFFRI